MRFFIPLALLATSAMAADKTAEDYLKELIPECVQSCYTDLFKTATGCDSLSDNDCVCGSIDKLMSFDDQDALKKLASCGKENASKCSKADGEKLSNLESSFTEAASNFQSSCPDTGMLPPSLVERVS